MKKTMTTALLLSFSLNAFSLEVGDKAPNFELPASDGQIYTLDQFNGDKSVVIAWYPAAFTSGCTVECKSLAENGYKIEEFDVEYFMASVDTIEKNTQFAEEYEATFPILSDESKTVAEAYDVMSAWGVAKRVTIYIDEEGIVTMIDEDISPATSAEDIATNLEILNVEKL